MSKLTLTDNTIDVISKMWEGNPGCLMALMQLTKEHNTIDPEAMMGALGLMFYFDDMNLYGSDIYVLFSDKCGGDVRRFVMMMRAVQLGLLSKSKVFKMGKDQARKLNLTEKEFMALDDKVCERLVKFKKRES